MENVAVALITTVPATVAALAALKHSKAASSSVGSVNGKGTLQQMVARVLDRQEEMDERLTRLESRAFRGGRK